MENIDKKIIAIKKNPNFETNFNRTIKTNLNNFFRDESSHSLYPRL